MAVVNKHKQIGGANFSIVGLTEDLTPDTATDYLATYDASAGLNKKVLLDNLGLGGGGNTFTTFQTPYGTSPVADSSSDTLTFESADSTIYISGNSTTDTINLQLSPIDLTVTSSATSTHPLIARGVLGQAVNTFEVQKSTASILFYVSETDVNSDVIFGLGQYTTGALPTASSYEGYLAYDSTTNEVKFSDGATWAGFGGGASALNDLSDASSDGSSYFIGTNAGLNDDSSANRNVAIGKDALKSATTASGCMAIGWGTLFTNITSPNNVGMGDQTLYYATGGYNTAVGASASGTNTTGQTNVAIGCISMQRNTTGSGNVGIGYASAYGAIGAVLTNTTNIGYETGYNQTTASGNIFVGWKAGHTTTTGSSNIILGYNIDASSATASSELNIGGIITGDISVGNVSTLGVFGAGQFATGSLPTASSFEGFIAYDTTTNEVKFSDGSTWAGFGGGSTVYSNPDGTHINTEIFGASATVTGTGATAIGYNVLAEFNSVSVGSSITSTGQYNVQVGAISAGGDRSTCVGYDSGNTATWQTSIGAFAGASAGNSSVSVGYNANAQGLYSVAVGLNVVAGLHGLSLGGATTAGNYSTCLGYNSTAGLRSVAIGWTMIAGADSVSIGYSSNAGNDMVAIGANANADSTRSIAIGSDSDTATFKTVVIGGGTATVNGQVLIGSSTLTASDLILGNGVSSATPSAVSISGTIGAGTNIAGKDLTIKAGVGTGTGVGGELLFQTAVAGTTGSTANTLNTVMKLTESGSLQLDGANYIGTGTISTTNETTLYLDSSKKNGFGTNGSGNNLALYNNDVRVLYWSTTSCTVGSLPFYCPNGSASAPTFAFAGMHDGGMYRDSGTDTLRIAINGVDSFTYEDNYTSSAKIFLPGQYATGSLPTASSYEGAIAYDTTTQTMKWSNGTVWATI